MANLAVYKWIAADAAAVAALQTTSGAATLSLNGTLSLPDNSGQFVSFNGISRVVTLTSTNNLSAVNVTITGFLNGAAVTATLAGPNNNTVTTSQLFDSVTKITTNGVVTAMSVGTGQTGNTHWFLSNTQEAVTNVAIQAIVTGTINYSFQVTLDTPSNFNVNPPAPAVFAPNVFTPVTALTGATGNQLGNYASPFKYCNVIINSSTAGATLTLTILQQGLHS